MYVKLRIGNIRKIPDAAIISVYINIIQNHADLHEYMFLQYVHVYICKYLTTLKRPMHMYLYFEVDYSV